MAAANCLRLGRSNMLALATLGACSPEIGPPSSTFPWLFDHDKGMERRLAVASSKALSLPPVSPIPASCSTVWSTATLLDWLQTTAAVLAGAAGVWTRGCKPCADAIMSSRAASVLPLLTCLHGEEPIAGNKAFYYYCFHLPTRTYSTPRPMSSYATVSISSSASTRIRSLIYRYAYLRGIWEARGGCIQKYLTIKRLSLAVFVTSAEAGAASVYPPAQLLRLGKMSTH